MIDTVVITATGTALTAGPDGFGRSIEVRPSMLTDLPRLVMAVMATCAGSKVATLVLPATDQLTPDLPAQLATYEGGMWGASNLADRSGWYQLGRPGPAANQPRRLHVCVLADLATAPYFASRCTLFDPGDRPRTILDRLRAYRDLTGGPFYATPGVSGIALIRQLGEHQSVRGPRPVWRWTDRKADAADELGRLAQLPADIVWRPDGTGPGVPAGHRWDCRGQFLAAACAAQLGTGLPEHTGPIQPRTDRHGWWRVVVHDVGKLPHVNSGGPPLWDRAAQTDDGSVWLTTPIMVAASSYGCPIEVHETFTAPTGTRHLRAWGEVLRDATYTLTGTGAYPPQMAESIKASYAWAIGLMNRPGGRLYRPDWRATIIDLARVLLYRKIARVREVTGSWPAYIDRDSVWYGRSVVADWQSRTEAGPAFNELIGEGSYIGNMRYEGYELAQGENR
jgi:hypothetical protein